eukprot:TRINITY_DN796_c0_g1_i3.p1 TRINITY_DN796_c0_g1~~TRINITY_DN796_c0_g1_i3.p1  ORF type:complete len:191 (-),score=26.92 TRINITY_DN796_c0_g1_i3:64-636(-)
MTSILLKSLKQVSVAGSSTLLRNTRNARTISTRPFRANLNNNTNRIAAQFQKSFFISSRCFGGLSGHPDPHHPEVMSHEADGSSHSVDHHDNHHVELDPSLTYYTRKQVSYHNKLDDCWIIISGRVYNVTDFVKQHPGGAVIAKNAGKDSTYDFENIGHSGWVQWDYMQRFYIGELHPQELPARRTNLEV